ncbi:MAG: phenylacetic acid degradation operon negative regulatory protein PaaX [Herminiimonas sp.]|nr:phenylacetic acid degradation operon negative regulatory protein PaaX [Herminiimonas sp.]
MYHLTVPTIDLDRWINDALARDPPRAKSLLVTLFGDAINPHGGKVWLGSLIALMAPFGINDRLVRTSVFRLGEEGWLSGQRDGRRSLYTLTPSGARRFQRAYDRIYRPARTDWDGQWTLVMAPPETVDAGARAALKKELLWEGYRGLATGLHAHPAADQDALSELLARLELTTNVFVCLAHEASLVGGKPLRDLADLHWDNAPIAAAYRDFLVAFTPLANALEADPESLKRHAPQVAFVMRSLLIHAFRRIQLHDPHLPAALLPSDWPGVAAYDLSQRLYRLTAPTSEVHLMQLLLEEDPGANVAAGDFHERFMAPA